MQSCEGRVFKMGLLTPWHLGYEFSGFTSASAITIAIEKVRLDPHLNSNGKIELRWAVGWSCFVMDLWVNFRILISKDSYGIDVIRVYNNNINNIFP